MRLVTVLNLAVITSRALSTKRPASAETGRIPWRCGCARVRARGRTAQGAASAAPATTGCPSGGSSSFRCGDLRCSSSTPVGGCECRNCGIVAEILPWAEGKQTLTNAYMQYLANWARKLSWLEVARTFRTSWQKVFHSVEWLVAWGLERLFFQV